MRRRFQSIKSSRIIVDSDSSGSSVDLSDESECSDSKENCGTTVSDNDMTVSISSSESSLNLGVFNVPADPTYSEQVYQETAILFQKSLYATIENERCSICSRASNANDLDKIDICDEAINSLISDSESADLPAKFSRVRSLYIHVHEIHSGNTREWVLGCIECVTMLRAGSFPVYSIQNYMFPEMIPEELQDITVAESIAIAKVFRRSIVWQSGRGHSVLKNHVVSFDRPIIDLQPVLPRSYESLNELLQIVFIQSSEKDDIVSRLPRVNVIRKQETKKALEWLIANNRLYADVETDYTVLKDEEYITPTSRTVKSDSHDIHIPSHSKFEISENHVRVRLYRGTEQEEFSSSGLFIAPVDEQRAQHIQVEASLNTWIKHSNSEFGLNASIYADSYMKVWEDLEWVLKSYPQLFPFGMTGPMTERKHAVSFEQWVRYLLLIKDDRFRKHYEFIFHMYNIIQRRKVYKNCRYGTLFNSF